MNCAAWCCCLHPRARVRSRVSCSACCHCPERPCSSSPPSSRHAQETAARGIDVRIRVDDAADQVFADPDRIEQVIENLFANALKHTPDGGTIALAATATPGSISLTVTDSGEGIPHEHLPHIFERFYKADQARTGGGGAAAASASRSPRPSSNATWG